MNAHIRNLENHANAQHDARMAVSEETREMEREQSRRELQAMRSQCGEAQVRIDLLLKAEARLQEEVRSGGYPAADARAESSERLLRAQLAARELERQVQDLRHVEEAQQRKIDMQQKTRRYVPGAARQAARTMGCMGLFRRRSRR